MKRYHGITPVLTKDEAREILFADRPDIKKLVETIEAAPEDKRATLVEIVMDILTRSESK